MLSTSLIFSAITALVAGIFAAIVLSRWAQKHRPHLLAWGIGLIFYCVGALAQVILALTWSPIAFGVWYWTGALMVAPTLGQGTLYLLVRRGSIARNISMLLALIGVMTLPWTLFLTPLNADAWRPGVDVTAVYRDITDANGNVAQPGIMSGRASGTVRAFSPVMNVWGTLALAGGALYSAYLFRRKQIMRNRVVGNWLIAGGALLPALGGALIRLDMPELKYLGEMLGVILIFVGFWIATNVADDMQTTQPTAAAEA
jgi:hypothetical protein